MKKSIIILGVFLVLVSFPSLAQNCNQGKNLAKKTWESCGTWNPKLQEGTFNKEVQKLKNSWNSLVSNTGFTIGPRFLEVVGIYQNGTIRGQTSSTFVTPPSFNDKMIIDIYKYAGRAQTSVVICAMDSDGVLTQLESFTFSNGKSRKRKKFTLNNIKGKIIIVAMKNLSVGYRFSYKIRAW